MLDTVSAPSPVPSEIFALVATIVVSGVALLILRYFLPLRATPAFYLVPIFFAIFLPAAIVLLVPIDLSSSARTEDAATRGIWLPDRVLLVSWRITYWLTFALTWFILPILAEYSDAGHREPYAKLMYSLRSNAQYYAIVLGASCIGLISIFVTYGFSFSSLKDVVMALAYCWGLIFVIYLMGHGLVSIPRQLFRNANLNGRLRRLQSHAPALYEKMEDSLLKLEDVEAQVAELKRRKIGSARDFDDWIEELAELAGIPDSGLAPPSDPALGAQVRAIPTVITEQYMATLARELIRARHARSRYVIEWNRLVQEAAETKAVLDSATSKKLEIGEANPESSPWSRTTILTPYTRYLLHYHVMPYVRIFLGSVLSLASVSIIWSEIFKVFGQRFSISIIRFTVVHHWVDSKPQVGFGGQVVSTLWILYMCAAAFTSITEVKVWRGRALTRRNTAYESAFWYSQQVAKLSVPLSYNFVTLLSEDIYTKTTFYQFLGKIIDFTPLGRWFDFLFPIFILLPVFATLFGMYGRVRRFLGFGLVITDDDEEEGEPGRRSYAAAGSWREGRDLIDRDLSGHSLSRRRDEARPRAAGAGQGRSAPVLSIPPARGGGASPVRSPVRGGGAAARRAGSSRDAWEEPTEDENFFQLLGHRMKNTVDTFESPRWLQEIGEGVRKPKWMGGVSKPLGLAGRTATLHPGDRARESGRGFRAEEAEALRFISDDDVPVPHVHNVETTPDGKTHIWMDYIPGDTLSKIWTSLSEDQKRDIARQVRDILGVMRSIKPREEHIRSCGGSQVRDSRDYFPYTAPACRNELEFNDYLLTGLMYHTPPALRTAFSRRLRTGHRVVFTHADLAPRNIIVRDGKIVGLLDWEDAGWYPEYWEYVKFFHRVGSGSLWDWLRYADDIFSATDENELVHYIGLPTWQDP